MNGQGASLLLDSGAHITVVPEDMVEESSRTGRSVFVKAFRSESSMRMPTAKVKFGVEGMEDWEEVVALAPVEKGKETEVLYGLKLRSPRGLDLVILANRLGEMEVRRVTTRAEAKQETSKEEENARVVEVERPKVKSVMAEARKIPVERAVAVEAVVVEAVDKAVEAAKPRGKKRAKEKGAAGNSLAAEPNPSSFVLEVVDSEKGTGEGELAADRPVSNPEPVAQDVVCEEEELPDLASIAAEEVNLEEEVEYCLRKGGRLEDLEFPPVRKGPGSRAMLFRFRGKRTEFTETLV